MAGRGWDGSDKEFVARFVHAHGRGPSTLEMTLMKEARASRRLDEEPEGGTYAIEEVGPEGGYTVQGPVASEEQKYSETEWKDLEIARLKGLLRESLDGLERAFDEGWKARSSVKGKDVSSDEYNLYKVSENDEAEGV